MPVRKKKTKRKIQGYSITHNTQHASHYYYYCTNRNKSKRSREGERLNVQCSNNLILGSTWLLVVDGEWRMKNEEFFKYEKRGEK